MPYSPPIKKDTSPQALASLSTALDQLSEKEQLETEIQAHAFSQQCLRELEERERLESAERWTTELLQVAVAPAVGALAAWKTTRGIPVGAILNLTLGVAGKGAAILNPKHRVLRVAGQIGKVALHSQLSLWSNGMMEGAP